MGSPWPFSPWLAIANGPTNLVAVVLLASGVLLSTGSIGADWNDLKKEPEERDILW